MFFLKLLLAPQCLFYSPFDICLVTESHLPVLLMLLNCTASHVEISNHPLIESLWRENLKHRNQSSWLIGSGMILRPGMLRVLSGSAVWQRRRPFPGKLFSAQIFLRHCVWKLYIVCVFFRLIWFWSDQNWETLRLKSKDVSIFGLPVLIVLTHITMSTTTCTYCPCFISFHACANNCLYS